MRKILILLAVLLGLGVLTFPLWNGGSPDEDGPRALPPYTFTNPVSLPALPADAFAASLWEDPVERAARRLEWGTPEVVYWTQRHLPEDRDRFRRRVEERLVLVAKSSPVARYLIETLGVIGDARSVPLLRRYAASDPDYLQLAALTALQHCPIDDETETVLVELSQSPHPQVSNAARRAVIERAEFWNDDTIRSYLETLRGPEANLLIDRVGEARKVELADAVAAHLDEEDAGTRRLAIRAAMRLGDPRGLAAAALELDRTEPRSVQLGLTIYRDVGLLPPMDRARRLAHHEDPEVRHALIEALAKGEQADPALRSDALELLQSIADSADPVLASGAVRAMQSWDHLENLGAYRDRIREDHGESLKEAVRFLCEVLRDREAAPLVRARLAEPGLDAIDVANLLFGLRFVGDPVVDAPAYLEWILRAGTAEDRRSASVTHLSGYASLYLQTLGGRTVPALVAPFASAAGDRVRLVLIDTLRGVARDAEDPAALLERFLAWAQDESLSIEVRVAALESAMFVEHPDVGERLRRVAETSTRRELADRARRMVLCFY